MALSRGSGWQLKTSRITAPIFFVYYPYSFFALITLQLSCLGLISICCLFCDCERALEDCIETIAIFLRKPFNEIVGVNLRDVQLLILDSAGNGI